MLKASSMSVLFVATSAVVVVVGIASATATTNYSQRLHLF